MPITAPRRRACPSSHDGHHLGVTEPGVRPEGASTAIAIAVAATSSDQEARANRQSPCTAGRTPKGVVKTLGMVSPMRIPLLNTAVATEIRRGNHSRTNAGNAGWLTATPRPIRNEDPNSTVVLDPAPLSALNTATAPSPIASAVRIRILAKQREAGPAANAKQRTGS